MKKLPTFAAQSLRALCVLAFGLGLLGSSVVPVQASAAVQNTHAEVSPAGFAGAAAAKALGNVKTTAALNLRKGASTKSGILLTIPRRTTLSPLKRAVNGWYQVKYKSRTGWVSNKYVSAVKTPKASVQEFDQYRGPNHTKRVILTYDDCPLNLKDFQRVLDYVARQNIALVLAPTGNCLKKFKKKHGVDVASMARAKGQWVISHTATHPDMRTLSCAAGAKELTRSGVATNVGRPPYGGINDNVRCAFKKADMSLWTWTRSTRDWDVKNKKTTIARASAAGPGETVLMHMHWHGFSPDSIAQIRDRLNKKNVKLCRAYHGAKGSGPVRKTPLKIPGSLPC